jgi:benzodiazapine receptor
MSSGDFLKLAVSIIACEGAGFIGSIFTIKSINGWYKEVKKPRFTPPDAVFGPIWLSLYLLMGIAVFLVWRLGTGETIHRVALIVFIGQLVLNVLWSELFFGRRSPGAGLVNIILLWITILLNIILFFKISVAAGVLLIPYILWVSVATYLNAGILALKRSKK